MLEDMSQNSGFSILEQSSVNGRSAILLERTSSYSLLTLSTCALSVIPVMETNHIEVWKLWP